MNVPYCETEQKKRIDTERFSLITIILVLFSHPSVVEQLRVIHYFS